MSANVILFEDRYVDRLRPISLTRPPFAITCAGYRLVDLVATLADCLSCIVRPHLLKVSQREMPDVEPAAAPTLYVNAALMPDVRYLDRLKRFIEAGDPFLCTCGERVVAALLPEKCRPSSDLTPDTVTAHILSQNLPLVENDGFKLFEYPFHVVGAVEELFPANIEYRIRTGDYKELRPNVYVGEGVRIAGSSVLTVEDGPIVLEDNVRVMDFTYLQGPIHVGANSRVIERSSVKEFTSIGHTCKIGGEVEISTIESYSNKQHHGFLGHAYIGSWVNMGAGTSNSDLKNSYGVIRIEHSGERVNTGLQFFGCVIGDFSKTAINTSIFTGKIIGVCSMLYGYVGQNVPSFCNYAKLFGQITECPVAAAVQTQKRMFARRQVEQTQEDIELLHAVFELTREERLISSELPVI